MLGAYLIIYPPEGRCLGPLGLEPGMVAGRLFGAPEGREIGPPGLLFGTRAPGRFELPGPDSGELFFDPSTPAFFISSPDLELAGTDPGMELLLEALEMPIFFPASPD